MAEGRAGLGKSPFGKCVPSGVETRLPPRSHSPRGLGAEMSGFGLSPKFPAL